VVEQDEMITNKADLFNKLHEYACNPDNFWPEIRNQIDHLTDAFHSIQQSGNLIWVDSVKFVSDDPGKNDGSEGLGGGGASTNELIQLVNQAKVSLDIQSPYLIAGDAGIKIFKNAVGRGVKIRIMTNSLASTDNVEAFSGYQREREKLLKAGVRIFEFKPDAAERYRIMTGALQKEIEYAPIFGLHAKSMVVDGAVAVIGTFNLDPRSANLNTECFAVIHSIPIAQSVLGGMEEEFKPENSWETTLEYNPDSEVSVGKSIKTWTRKIIPKSIL
jgi:phosphatidylserine/phosphatidylglycerophosphate/cardiolipin synthase-like enzyme